MMVSCSCCSGLPSGRFDRRHFLRAAGLTGLAAALPLPAMAAPVSYEAMLLSCIDPRMVEPVYKYLDRRGLTGQYSQFVIAGAAVAVIAPKFEAWHQTFWDNLKTSFHLHRVNRVIAIDHRDCSAAKIAYGPDSIATPQAETETHRKVLAEFRAQMHQRHPAITVETGLMALDGSLLPLG